MSGPVAPADAEAAPPAAPEAPATTERHDARVVEVGGLTVRRLLPRRARRTVGAWCFVDHVGPATATMGVGPHPHIGLQTVTWLLDGEIRHTDSLGSDQVIRPGQLNLMTAGRGVAHAEESTGASSSVHAVQLWVAQPSPTRDGAPAFEHHAELPVVELGSGTATVLVGDLDGASSPARADSPLVGIAVDLHAGGASSLPIVSAYEHAVVPLDVPVTVGDDDVAPGQLAYVGPGRDELVLRTAGDARLLVLGGAPFGERLTMWWNFVARDRDEIAAARADWHAGDERFGPVASNLERIDAPPLR